MLHFPQRGPAIVHETFEDLDDAKNAANFFIRTDRIGILLVWDDNDQLVYEVTAPWKEEEMLARQAAGESME